jgi:lysophospholipase L1-like esterase
MSSHAMRTDAPATPRTRRASRWAFSVGAAFAFAGALEWTAREVLPRESLPVLIAPLANLNTPDEFFRPDPTLLWALRPNVADGLPNFWGDVTNSEGLRMRREVGPKDGRIRVVCFGDSCTYGLGVRVDDAWPNVLGADPALDVVNAGVPVYSSYQGALYADMRCPEWKPDVVVVEFGANDATPWLQFDHGRVVAMTDVEIAPHVRLDALLHKSALLGWIAALTGTPKTHPVDPALLAAARPRRGSRDLEMDAAGALMSNDCAQLTPRVPPDVYRANLARIAAHAPLAIVLKWPRRRLLDPSLPDFMSPRRMAPYFEAMDAAVSDGADVVDVAAPLLASGLTADQAFVDVVHGTRAMSDLVAAAVRGKIRARLRR